jgi:hypothetical protein
MNEQENDWWSDLYKGFWWKIKSDSHETWKCADQELERQISCFPYVELSDVPRLQQVHKSRRTAEESRINHTPPHVNLALSNVSITNSLCNIARSYCYYPYLLHILINAYVNVFLHLLITVQLQIHQHDIRCPLRQFVQK